MGLCSCKRFFLSLTTSWTTLLLGEVSHVGTECRRYITLMYVSCLHFLCSCYMPWAIAGTVACIHPVSGTDAAESVLQVGMVAINDGIILESCIYRILKSHFRSSPYYTELLDLFHEVSLSAEALSCTTAARNAVCKQHPHCFCLNLHLLGVCACTCLACMFVPRCMLFHSLAPTVCNRG